ncbi:MAG TPA: retropepsin-like aspartic protease, partial [Pirellulales bacterium]|nr:retropepsin-like aspartic protease [Pirellulales bacterium]
MITANAAAAAEADSNVLAEFTIDSYTEFLRVPVTISGKTYHFFIDTGANQSSFDLQMQSVLGKPSGREELSTVHRTVSLAVYNAPPATIADIPLPRLFVTCIDHSINRGLRTKIHGYLGMDAINGLIVRADFERRKLSFLRSVPKNAGVRIDLDRRRLCPTV